MNIKAVLIDDEQNNLDNLFNLLKLYCPDIFVCSTARSVETGRKIILKYKPEIIFLDISMPGKNGFDLLRSLPTSDFEVIFVTAYENYAIQAIKFAAVDYLMKPIEINELKQAVNRAVERRKKNMENLKLENLLFLLKTQNEKNNHRIALGTLKETRFIKTQDIIRCESTNNYTSFFIKGGEKIVVSKPIYLFEEILVQYGFIRCHQSHLINLDFVKSWIKKDGEYLLLKDGSQIPISRGKRDTVKLILRDGRI